MTIGGGHVSREGDGLPGLDPDPGRRQGAVGAVHEAQMGGFGSIVQRKLRQDNNVCVRSTIKVVTHNARYKP